MLASPGHPTAVGKHVLGGRLGGRGVSVATLAVGLIPGGVSSPGGMDTAVVTAVKPTIAVVTPTIFVTRASTPAINSFHTRQ